MCGWIAVIGRHGQSCPPDAVARALGALVHRGPDDRGIYRAGNVTLGFRRLAIVDLTPAGHQPMLSADEQTVVVFNGEIYNHTEVRCELQRAGVRFVSSCDTEVLLEAYRHWGPECVHRFNGMFSFLVYDRRTSTLFGARDRLGVKPLYLWEDKDWLILASEPAAIGASGLHELRPDWDRLQMALRWGWMDHGQGTCLANVRQAPAAHVLTIDRQGELTTRPYWSLPDSQGDPVRSDNDWIDQLSDLVSEAVRLRMPAEVPMGFTLSGGVDSTLLICEAARQGAGPLRAYSFHDECFDESDLIRDTVTATGAEVHRLRREDLDLASLLPRVIAANGEPVHSMSAVANYALFERARQHGIKVMLGGQGADEVFAGYSSFEVDYWHTLATNLHWGRLWNDVRASAGMHGRSASRLMLSSLARSMQVALSGSWVGRGARAMRRGHADAVGHRHPGFAGDFWSSGSAAGLPSAVPCGQTLQQRQRVAATFEPLPMYLRIEDRVSMAHSIEARLPFTDYRLVEHAFRLPDHLRYAGGLNKVALRRVAARRVPASVMARTTKLGFPVGRSSAIAGSLQRLCRDITSTRAFRERGIYDLDGVERLLARSAETVDPYALFHLAQTELWLDSLDQARLAAQSPSRPLLAEVNAEHLGPVRQPARPAMAD